MRMLKSIATALLFVSVSFGAAHAADIEGMPIRIGDTLDKVQDVYKTDMMPEPIKSIREGTKGLRLKTKGVWFFFDKDGKIETIRLDAPFEGRINGVRVADTSAKMREVLGEPAKTLKQRAEGYLYYIDDRTTARFDLGEDKKIETIFLFE